MPVHAINNNVANAVSSTCLVIFVISYVVRYTRDMCWCYLDIDSVYTSYISFAGHTREDADIPAKIGILAQS